MLGEHQHYKQKREKALANISRLEIDQFESKKLREFITKNRTRQYTKEQVDELYQMVIYNKIQKKKAHEGSKRFAQAKMEEDTRNALDFYDKNRRKDRQQESQQSKSH